MTDEPTGPTTRLDLASVQALARLLAALAEDTSDPMYAASARGWSERLRAEAARLEVHGDAEPVVVAPSPAGPDVDLLVAAAVSEDPDLAHLPADALDAAAVLAIRTPDATAAGGAAAARLLRSIADRYADADGPEDTP